jgi:hypothetical protein
MQAAVPSVATSTVWIQSSTHNFRVWYNPAGYWQTDIKNAGQDRVLGEPLWLYFGQASSLIQAMTNIAIITL